MPNDQLAERVLIVAPIGRDAAAIAGVLNDNGYCTQVCSGAAEAAAQAVSGAGALVLTEESLEREHIPALLSQLAAQPTWSELPVILLTTGGGGSTVRLLGDRGWPAPSRSRPPRMPCADDRSSPAPIVVSRIQACPDAPSWRHVGPSDRFETLRRQREAPRHVGFQRRRRRRHGASPHSASRLHWNPRGAVPW
jgi:hypothetical protein